MNEVQPQRASLAGSLDGRRHAGGHERASQGDGSKELRCLTGHRRAESAR
ncbi:hypothetical protein EKH55_2753 [Sinorhizobium alkalisoli]|nr:hypothetical protein EKH55_2753 [Sinorhizobium alkalisoli]